MSDRDALTAFVKSPLSRFKAWRTPEGRSPQAEFFRAARLHKTRIFRSGNQIGKTTAGAVDTLLHCLGMHPWSQFKPPVKWWASGLDWEFGIGQVIWPALREFLPLDSVRSITFMRKAEPQLPLEITFHNGSTLTFKSCDSGRKKYQGAALHGVWIDEEHEEDVVEEIRARLIKNLGYLTCTLTPLMRMRCIQDIEREEDTYCIRASMIEAAHGGLLDLEAVLKFEAALPERQRRVRVHGDYVSLEGMVYPTLQRMTHAAIPIGKQLCIGGRYIAPWPIPDAWERWAAIDWGINNPTAVLLGAMCPYQERMIVYRCFYSAGIRASQWAALLHSRLPELRVPLISDHDAQARAECEAEGLHTTAAYKDINAGLEAVERSLVKECTDGMPGLVFVEDECNDKVLGRCDTSKLLWELESYHYPKKRAGRPDPIDKPVKKDDHACDALRYLIVSWEQGAGQVPMPPEANNEYKSWRGNDILAQPSEALHTESRLNLLWDD